MVEGGCLCGAVRFAVTGFKGGIFKCHCSRCRKAFGGASSAAAFVDEGQFSWLQGEGDVREFQCDSGFTRRFCPDCGSILPQHLADYRMHWVHMQNAKYLELGFMQNSSKCKINVN